MEPVGPPASGEHCGWAGGRPPAPGGTVAIAKLQIGDSLINVSDQSPERGYPGPKAIGGTPVTLNVYAEDADAAVQRAIAAGATPLQPVENQFYGDRIGRFEDPWGHRWAVATHVQDVSAEELTRRTEAMGG